jgi:hypothetical protein
VNDDIGETRWYPDVSVALDGSIIVTWALCRTEDIYTPKEFDIYTHLVTNGILIKNKNLKDNKFFRKTHLLYSLPLPSLTDLIG